MKKHELPQLPYALDALEPQISKETLEYHHGKHHKAYVDKLNELIEGTRFADMDLEQIIMESDGAIFNNAAQDWNHTLYFLTFSPNPKTRPEGPLAKAIDEKFGSFDNFREEFVKGGVGQFGSGWVWLVKDKDGKVAIEATSNAKNPMTEGKTPIATLDVWEHAYYIDYRNRRPDHLQKAFEKIDWSIVEQRYEGKK